MTPRVPIGLGSPPRTNREPQFQTVGTEETKQKKRKTRWPMRSNKKRINRSGCTRSTRSWWRRRNGCATATPWWWAIRWCCSSTSCWCAASRPRRCSTSASSPAAAPWPPPWPCPTTAWSSPATSARSSPASVTTLDEPMCNDVYEGRCALSVADSVAERRKNQRKWQLWRFTL